MPVRRSLMPIIYALFVMQVVTGAFYAAALIERHQGLRAIERRLDIMQARLAEPVGNATADQRYRAALARSAANRRDLDRLKHESDALDRHHARIRPLVALQVAIAVLAFMAAHIERRRRREERGENRSGPVPVLQAS